MHPEAKRWDRDHGFITEFGAKERIIPKELPRGRPCDWCGKIVPEGYIHPSCHEQEREKWYDILY